MKRTRQPSTISKKLTSVPELPYKKGILNSPRKPKEKRNAKPTHDNVEPMVLGSPPTGESIVRYALPIPSSKTKDLITEDEMVQKIVKHLKMVASSLDDTYGAFSEDREKIRVKSAEEDLSLSVGDDMNAFLLCCSQFAAQLEEAVKEERNVLESLFKWFQKQVNQMEEIGKDQSILERDLPSDDKSVNLSIAQIAKLMHKVEDLKTRLKTSTLPKRMDKKALSEKMKSYDTVGKQIEEFIKSHPALESEVVSETDRETPYSVTNRMNVMIKMFENQTSMLERALNDQSIIETRYKQMEADFQMLILEKILLENEIRKMKDTEKPKLPSKKPAKSEKKKDKDSERKISPSQELKAYEELLQIQKEAEELRMEKQALQKQLKWALEEAERNKNQLSNVLHQDMETSKEGKSKTKVTGEDPKPTQPTDRVTQAGGQRQTQDKISTEQSLENPSALEGFSGASDDRSLPDDEHSPENFKSSTAMPSTEEHQEPSPPQPKETEMSSLVSFPVLTDETEENEAPEQILSQTEAENIKVIYEIPKESPAPEDKDLLSALQVPPGTRLTDRGKRKSLFIAAKTPDVNNLISRTKSEMENLDATKYESVFNPYSDVDEALSPESQGSVSEADSQTKTQRTHKRERPIASNKKPENQLEHKESELKSEIQSKKLKVSNYENVRFAEPDESNALFHQESAAETQMQVERGTTSEDARHSTD